MATITVDIVATGGAQFQREFERAAQTMGSTFPQASQKAEAQVKSMTRSLEVQSAVWARVQSQAIGAFAGAIGISAMVSFTKQVVANTNALIGWQNALAAVTPSSQAAAYNLEYIRSEADRLGLELESLAGIFTRFSAATRGTSLEGEQTREIFSAMAEAARVLNLSTDGVAGAFRALEQMVSKGSVQAEELRQQLGERLPGAFRMVADAMGVSTAELNKMLERGEVTADEMLPKLAARLREVYSAASVGAANSPAAEFNRLANAMFDLRVAIGESGVMESLTKGSRQLTESLRTLVDGGALDKIASGLGNIALASGVVFGGKALSSLTSYIGAMARSAQETVAAAKANEGAAIAAQRRAAAEATAAGSARLYAEQVMRSSVGTEYAAKAANELAAARVAQNRANLNLVLSEKNLAAAQAQSAASASVATVAAGKFASAAGTVFTALGGWVTVAVAAAYALYQIQDAMRNGDAETQKMVSSLNDMSARMEKNAESALKMRQGVTSATVESSNAIQDMTANIKRLEESTESVIPKLDDWKSKLLAVGSIAGLIHAGVYERFRDTSAIDAANEALETFYQATAKTVAVSNDVAKSYEEQARAVFVGSGSMDAYNKAIAEATPEMARAIIYSDDMSKAFENAASVLTKAGGDVDELRMEVMRLASDGKVNAREFAEVFEIVFGQVGKDAADLANKIGDTAVQIATAFGLMRRAGEGETESFTLSKATQDYIDKLREEQVQLALSKEEMIRYTATKRIAAVHADESVKNKEAEIAAIVAETEALIRSVHAADARKGATKGLADAEKQAAAEAKKRADAYADSARTMIQLAGATNDLAGAESAYKIAVMDAMEVANQQIEAGMQMVDVQTQLSATIEAATAILEEQTAAALENQRAHEQVIDDLELERKLIGMTDAERKKALAGLRAEQAMRQAIAVAQKAGAGFSAKQVQDYLDLARAAGIANAALDQYQQFLQQIGMTDSGDGLAAPIWEAVEASETLQDRLRDAFSDTGIEKLQDDVAKLGQLLGKLSKDDAGYAQVRLSYARANVELWEAQAQKTVNVIGEVGSLTQAIGSMFAESESGQRRAAQLAAALAVAEQAALVPVMIAKASEAVANQAAKGDPYSAFARAAIMAGALAPFVAAVGGALPAFGSSGGPAANSAAYRQEHQGTGTVLGDAAAKSESIARATEITASATQQLVGINRSMLNALQAMQAGISGASGLLARGTRGPDISLGAGLGSALSGIPIVGNLLGGLVSSIFGGKESLRDQGIRIVGGYLSSMIDDIMVQSYASIHRSGGWFRSSRDYDRFTTLGDDVAAQFGLVLGSMADAVRAAADALGLNMDAINAAIAAYRIEEIRISTMDLSAEEAQAELAAVFSSIFDGLAGAVVPFIGQFQQVGEGLGETLIRVATGVQVTQEALIQLGFALDETDPEKFAQISEGLMSLMGGIDGFIEGMSSFVNAFATDEHKFAVAQDALTRAFAQFGLEIPESRDAMWDLMQGLDATTESGRQQIAMLLQLADVSDAYYTMLEDSASRMAAIEASIADGAWQQYLDGLTDSQRAIAEITRYYDDWTAQLIASGATVEQLAAVEEQRTVALANQEAALLAQRGSITGNLQRDIDQLGMTDYQREIAGIHEQRQAYIDSLVATGMSLAAATVATREWRDAMLGAAAAAEAERLRQEALRYNELAQSLADELAVAQGASEYRQEIVRIDRAYRDNVRNLNEAARAAGRAGASERDLARALELATIQRAKALMQLEQEAAALAGQLRMSALDAQIAQLSEIENAATSAMTGFAGAVRDAGRAAAEAMGLLLGSYSPLRASDKLPIALQALQRGETDANTVLKIARDVYASGAAYNAIFDQVMAITQSSGRDVGGGSSAPRVSAEMQALLDQRAELEAQQAQRELFTQSSQLAAMIAELSSARGEDYDAIANLLQYDLSQLAADLGLDGLGALTEYLDNVAKEQASIADLFDLPTAGDLEIVGAINDLTDAIVGDDFAPGDIPPIEAIPENTRDTEQQDQLAADTREMVTLLRAMVERGLPASEDTATAAERLVDAVERIGDAIESDGGAALAAETRRGG